jgi:HK97 family phage major capsid protein
VQAVEGDQKAEMALDLALKQAPVRTIAVWIPASRQALDDEALLADYIDTELRDALQLTEDAQLLKSDGTGANLSGLWTQAVAYSRAVVGDSPSDTLRRAITQVQLARGVATGVVINPIGLELLELDKDNEGRYQLAYTVTDADGRTSVWRVPVVVTDALAANEFLVGDFSRAARLYDRQQATVEIATQHADFFTRNLVAILAEERLALAVNRPDMLVKGTFTTV